MVIDAAMSFQHWQTRERLEQIQSLIGTLGNAPGRFCEFGVATGSSAMVIAASDPSRDFYAFDTFSGMPEPGEDDRRILGATAEDLTGHCVGNRDEVERRIREQGEFPGLHLVEGDICETVKTLTDPVAFMHIDCDRFDAVTAALEGVKLYPGSIVVANCFWNTTRQAIERWMATNPFSCGGYGPAWQPKLEQGPSKQVWFRVPPHGHISMFGDHLGGYKPATEKRPHGNPESYETAMWQWLLDTNPIQRVMDIGCGEGHCLKWFQDQGRMVHGVEGNPEAILFSPVQDAIVRRDYKNDDTGVLFAPDPMDLILSTEFLEHIDECHVDRVLSDIESNTKPGTIVAVTASQDAGGHHHVLLRPQEWWVKRFSEWGCEFDETLTAELRQRSNGYFKQTGMAFIRNEKDVW